MSKPWDALNALATALSVITVANDYNTDIGSKIVLYDQQRRDTKRPSIAISSRTGRIDRTNETGAGGNRLASFARQMDFALEVGLNAASADAQRIAHDALEDIERVCLAIVKDNNAMPTGVSRIAFTSWSILDRPDGIDAVVLQVVGSIEYRRNPT